SRCRKAAGCDPDRTGPGGSAGSWVPRGGRRTGQQVFQQGQGDGAMARQGILVQGVDQRRQAAHVAVAAGQDPAQHFVGQLQPALLGAVAQGLGTVLVGQLLQAVDQVPAQAGAQVFAQRHGQGCAVARRQQGEGARRARGGAPAVEQGEQRGLGGRVQVGDVVHRHQGQGLVFVGGQGVQPL